MTPDNYAVSVIVSLAATAATIYVATGRGQTDGQDTNSQWWASYRAYLRSQAWQIKRDAVIRRAGGRCEICGQLRRLTVHHLSYRNLPEELPEDLAALCYWCHRAQHPDKRF